MCGVLDHSKGEHRPIKEMVAISFDFKMIINLNKCGKVQRAQADFTPHTPRSQGMRTKPPAKGIHPGL